MISILLRGGASSLLKNSSGQTALDILEDVESKRDKGELDYEFFPSFLFILF